MSPSHQVARLYIQLKTRELDRPFDYRVPLEMAPGLQAGAVVLVPFGRQKALGIVVETDVSATVSAERLVDIESVIDYPPVPASLMRLALWVSRYYYCSPAAALTLVSPPGGLPALVSSGGAGEKTYSLKAPPVKARSIRFVRLAATTHVPVAANGDADTGYQVMASPASPPSFRNTAARRRLLDTLARETELPVARALERAKIGRGTLNSLAEVGIVEIFSRQVSRESHRFYGNLESEPTRAPLTLNLPQERALAAIVSRLDAADPAERARPILIEGVAGAGKTEVYLRAIEAAIAQGGRAIVLVPEISLTHQAVKRFRRRFGERIGVLHSGLGLGERYDEYARIRAGAVDVVIGPRSALFAPIPDLKLIVIDEENDSSFKQESEPRYDARRTALERARLEGIALVYGSATPSLESYQRVQDRYALPERATGAAMPSVEIVDMRDEIDHVFSARLLTEIEANLKRGGKAILLLNSRGWARFLQCAACGHVWKCPNCEVTLTLHQGAGSMLCHHCGHAEPVPDFCPACRSAEIRRWGIGTEQLQQRVKKLFPEASVFRLDADTSRGYGEGPRILEEFGAAGRAILVGTQMVAKGHHFPDVTLSAVINADLALEFPEFRAEEQTFSLLLQLAGRSGRAELPGKVLIQTWNADIECIRMAADGALDEFYSRELERRRRLDYPPFTGLINIVFLSRDEHKPMEAAAHLKSKLEPVLGEVRVLGPAPLFKLKGRARGHILIKTQDTEGTLAAIGPVIEHYREPYGTRDVRIVVDVDPQWLS
ncbi:MAG: replication restart helicase PriA [Thermoleophilia bacterium]